MKKIVLSLVALTLAGMIGFGCASASGSGKDAPQASSAGSTAAPAKTEASAAAAPASATVDTDGNLLADGIGAVTIVIDQDTTLLPAKTKDGATLSTVTFDGKKAIKITRNSSGEVRVAFVLKTPTKLGAYKTLQYDIAGFNGYEGNYNCALFYTETNPGKSGERMPSFYLSNVLKDKWTTVTANLASNEQWTKNYSPDRELYAIQFWSNQAKTLYITNLTLLP